MSSTFKSHKTKNGIMLDHAFHSLGLVFSVKVYSVDGFQIRSLIFSAIFVLAMLLPSHLEIEVFFDYPVCTRGMVRVVFQEPLGRLPNKI